MKLVRLVSRVCFLHEVCGAIAPFWAARPARNAGLTVRVGNAAELRAAKRERERPHSWSALTLAARGLLASARSLALFGDHHLNTAVPGAILLGGVGDQRLFLAVAFGGHARSIHAVRGDGVDHRLGARLAEAKIVGRR